MVGGLHIDANEVPVAAAVIGGFLIIFGLYSAVLKERLYLSEALISTTLGCLTGPYLLGVFQPQQWSSLNTIILEASRLVIAMQIMAAVLTLPVHYYRHHWKSILVLLLPVMTCSWLVTAALIYWIMDMDFTKALIIGATMAPTDPILANSIVKGSFADRHVPRHIRYLLSGESACNDSTTAAFVWIGILIFRMGHDVGGLLRDFVLWICLYELALGALFGAVVGWIARHALKYSELHDLIDQENFLSFAIALSIFVDGVSALLQMNDFLAVLTAAIAFSWDGSFHQVTKKSQIQEVLDNLVNAWFFVFLGSIVPWDTLLHGAIPFWRYIVLAIAILGLRRIPVTFAFYPILPSLTNPLEALFVGHFGPIAVGTVYYMAMLRKEFPASSGGDVLAHHLSAAASAAAGTLTTASAEGGPTDAFPELEPTIMAVVLASIIVHGMTIPLFKAGTIAARTLSATSTRSRSRSRAAANAPLRPRSNLGVDAISGPMNARPMYAAVPLAAPSGSDATIRGASTDQENGWGTPKVDAVEAAQATAGSLGYVRETTISIVDPALFLPSRRDEAEAVEVEDEVGMVHVMEEVRGRPGAPPGGRRIVE
ncbi:hypothetical protein GGF31_004677 [Allomyces arbusculus]|nr:hypothetical protein GGF31_004677 [Allomyces arbusculus]